MSPERGQAEASNTADLPERLRHLYRAHGDKTVLGATLLEAADRIEALEVDEEEIHQDAVAAWDKDDDPRLHGQAYGYRKGYKAAAEPRDQRLAEKRREIAHIETERERQRVEIAKELERTRTLLASRDHHLEALEADTETSAGAAWEAECVKYELPLDTTFYFRIGNKADWMNGFKAAAESLADRVEVAEGFARAQSDREFELLALLESRDQHVKKLEVVFETVRETIDWHGGFANDAAGEVMRDALLAAIAEVEPGLLERLRTLDEKTSDRTELRRQEDELEIARLTAEGRSSAPKKAAAHVGEVEPGLRAPAVRAASSKKRGPRL